MYSTLAGIKTTGMYFNPAMATGHTFGCGPTTTLEHLTVYWIGPFLGCFLAIVVDKFLHIDVVRRTEQNKKNM